MPTILTLIEYAIFIINRYLIPLVFALALIVFLWGIFQMFILGGKDPKKVTEGRQFALWGIIGFAVMVSVWGLVQILVNSVPFGSFARPTIPKFNEQTQQSQGGQFYFPPASSAPKVGDSCSTNADCGAVLACVQGTCVDTL